MGKLLCSANILRTPYVQFNKEFMNIVGMSVAEFKQKSVFMETNYDMMWYDDSFRLIYTGNDSFYRLYER